MPWLISVCIILITYIIIKICFFFLFTIFLFFQDWKSNITNSSCRFFCVSGATKYKCWLQKKYNEDIGTKLLKHSRKEPFQLDFDFWNLLWNVNFTVENIQMHHQPKIYYSYRMFGLVWVGKGIGVRNVLGVIPEEPPFL